MKKLDLDKLKKTKKLPANEGVIKLELPTQTEAIQKLEDKIKALYEYFNDREEYDFDILKGQLEQIGTKLDLEGHFKSLESAIASLKTDKPLEANIQGFSELLTAIRENKVEPTVVDFSEVIKALDNVVNVIQNQEVKEPKDQTAANFTPVRRVYKAGNRFFFDDNLSQAGGGGGSSELLPVTDFDTIEVTASSSTTDTLAYKKAGNTIRTVVFTYTGAGVTKLSDDIDKVEYS